MVLVKRKENEPYERMLSRFNRYVQLSGILSEMKRKRFHERPIGRVKRREIAIRKKARKIAKLRAMGKII